MKKVYNWARKKVHTAHATPVLAFLVFIEGILFMTTSTLLLLYCLERPKKAWFYATITIIASILGGILGYLVGAFLWNIIGKPLISLFTKPEHFTELVQRYKTAGMGAIFIATFLPIPYKMVTLTAGFCKISFVQFLISISLARAIRFYLIAFTAYHWGDKIQQILDRFFYYLIALGIGLVIFYFLVL